MNTQSAVQEPSSPGHHPTSETAAAPGGPPGTPRTADRPRRARRARRWVVSVVALGLTGAVLTGWMGAARAASTDRLHTLNTELDQRVSATESTSDQLETVIVVARNIRSVSHGASSESRATLDAAVRSAEAVAEQRLTTQEPDSIAQAEMLVEQAAAMEQAIALTTTDLRTAVERVRLSRDGAQPARFELVGTRPVVAQP